jgi:hypothetical protein
MQINAGLCLYDGSVDVWAEEVEAKLHSGAVKSVVLNWSIIEGFATLERYVRHLDEVFCAFGCRMRPWTSVRPSF